MVAQRSSRKLRSLSF